MNGSLLCKLQDDLLWLCFYSPSVTAEAEGLQAQQAAQGELRKKQKARAVKDGQLLTLQRTVDFRGGGNKLSRKRSGCDGNFYITLYYSQTVTVDHL